MMIVVGQGCVVVVLIARYTSGARTKFPTFEYVVIVHAKESVLPQGELVARQELSHASRTAETVDVVDLGLRPHYVLVLAEALTTLVALCPEQPDVISFAVRLPVANEAGAMLVQKLLTLGTL